MRILFDHNIPVGLRRSLLGQQVYTLTEMEWPPQLENGELLKAAEAGKFDVLVTADQNISHQQNLQGRKLALVVLGSNIWPVVREHADKIAAAVAAAREGSLSFVEMAVPRKSER